MALRKEYPKVSIEKLCSLFDKRRQSFYDKRKVVISERQREHLLIAAVESYRHCCPGM